MTRRSALVGLVLAAACSRADATHAIPSDARRIVSVAPSTTESLFVIGAGDRVVGRSRYCDWPGETAGLPIVAGGLSPDLEVILQLRPDLVVGTRSGTSSQLADQLEARGIATWFPNVESLASIGQVIVGLGDRTAHGDDARRVVAALDARLHTVAQAVAGEPRPRVLFVVGVSPVVAAGRASFVDELLRLAGATNVVDSGLAWPTLGFERIVELDPDIVIDSSVGPERIPHITPQASGWSGVRAVRDGHVIVLDDQRVVRPGPRIAEGLDVLVRSLHPASRLP
jgi:iron complex transport system substrate-binding protein